MMNNAAAENGNLLGKIQGFWSSNPCGSWSGSSQEKLRYFQEVEDYRYRFIRHIPEVARFEEFKNKKVLEVGCGLGTDGKQFAKNGAIYTGINLDEGSTALAVENFKLSQLTGDIFQMNAEKMTFEDNSFDHVYSCGVIHHTESPEKILKEIVRVLKPGGTIQIMLYNKTSINYYFEIMFLRKVFRYLLIPAFAPVLLSRITGFDYKKLVKHREILLSEKMTKERWISINTDGPDCPMARVYSRKDISVTFGALGFREIKSYVRFFDKTHYSHLGKLIPDGLAERIGKKFGWCRWTEAVAK
jgi:ubiquinone/menaquinone biosynthesis C-methylase UbiE